MSARPDEKMLVAEIATFERSYLFSWLKSLIEKRRNIALSHIINDNDHDSVLRSQGRIRGIVEIENILINPGKFLEKPEQVEAVEPPRPRPNNRPG